MNKIKITETVRTFDTKGELIKENITNYSNDTTEEITYQYGVTGRMDGKIIKFGEDFSHIYKYKGNYTETFRQYGDGEPKLISKKYKNQLGIQELIFVNDSQFNIMDVTYYISGHKVNTQILVVGTEIDNVEYKNKLNFHMYNIDDKRRPLEEVSMCNIIIRTWRYDSDGYVIFDMRTGGEANHFVYDKEYDDKHRLIKLTKYRVIKED